MTGRHTKERLYVVHRGTFEQGLCADVDGERVTVATVHATHEKRLMLPAESNAQRLADCVNALSAAPSPESAVAFARAALKTVIHRYEANPGGDQIGLADAEACAEALRLLGGK